MKPIICVFCITKLSYMWAALKQIIYIVLISTIFGIIRFFFIEEESFTIIKSQKQLKTIEDYDLNHITNEQYSIPDLMTEPLLATTDFIKYYFDNNHAVIIDARDVEEYSNSQNITRKRLYLEAMEEILPRMTKILGDPGEVILVNPEDRRLLPIPLPSSD